jgi:hypothetical protein
MDTFFDGSFKFTNTSKEDFTFLWNNKEYTFPAESSSPMIIAGESLENIQEIRKRAAYKWAVREFFKTKEGKAIEKTASGYLNPATYSDKILEPFIQQCLNPLPLKAAVVKEGKVAKSKLDGGSKAIGNKKDGGLGNFKDEDVVVSEFGQMTE